jgi:AcrR family transcriptional regulator
MGRTAQYTAEEMVAAATRLVADQGPPGATITAIAEAVGAPTGSIYHRFPSRDTLLARVWLKTVEDFQSGFSGTLAGPDAFHAGLDAALYTPRWVRANPIAARVLLLHHRDEFVDAEWPADVSERALQLRREMDNALRSFARRALSATNINAMRRARYAVIDLPYAAVRPHLRACERPPANVDRLIQDAYCGVIPPRSGG